MKNILIISLLLISACSHAKIDPIITDFSHTIKLKGSMIPIKNIYLGEVVDIEIMDSLLVLNEMFSDKIFKLFNAHSGRLIGAYINKGKGPLEVVYPGRIHVFNKNLFLQYDRGLKQVDFFSIINNGIPQIGFCDKVKIDINQFETYPITDSTMLCTGVFIDGKRYCIYNFRNGKSNISGEYPNYKKIARFNDVDKAMIFQPTIAIKPDKKRFVSFEGRVAFFEIMSIDHLNSQRITSRSYFDPIIDVVEGHGVFKRNNLFTFRSATSTNKYIYVIYSGRSRDEFGDECYAGDNLLVYDWNGNPVVNYKLDRFLKIMALDVDKMQVYGFCTNPMTGEPEIVKYQLPHDPGK